MCCPQSDTAPNATDWTPGSFALRSGSENTTTLYGLGHGVVAALDPEVIPHCIWRQVP